MQLTMNIFNSIRARLLFFLCAILFIQITSIAQNAKITGSADGQINKLLRIITYEDQFSKLEKTLSATNTNSDGNFSFDMKVSQTLFSYLAVGLKRGEFYISPNSNYQFNILPDTLSQRGSIFDELPLQFTYTAEDEGLSDAIGAFNIQYNTFIYQYANKIYYGRDKGFIHEFEKKIIEQFRSFDNPYLENYIRYSFASLEWTSKMKDNDSIISEYFIGNPILYNNIQYAEFLSDFFKTYFIADKVFAYHELVSAINEGNGIPDIKSLVLRSDIFTKDPQLTELISILLLAKKYYNPDVKRSKVLELLQDFEKGIRFQENKRIAINFIKKLQILESGTKAPEFSLAGVNNAEYGLADYQGKFVLLSFIKPSCLICLDHLKMLDELVKKFHGKVQNLTLVYDQGYQDVIKYANERNFDWPFLKLENDILLLEAYNIRVYPSYVIVNPDGTIAMATAPMPDENLDIYLNRQIKRFEDMQSGE